MGIATTARKRVALQGLLGEIGCLFRALPLVARERHPLTNDRPSNHLPLHAQYHFLVTSGRCVPPSWSDAPTGRGSQLNTAERARNAAINVGLTSGSRRQRRLSAMFSTPGCFSRHFGPGPRM
jgi:hypothetical protein